MGRLSAAVGTVSPTPAASAGETGQQRSVAATMAVRSVVSRVSFGLLLCRCLPGVSKPELGPEIPCSHVAATRQRL